MGLVITNKLATMYELQTVYSYEDMLVLADIITVNSNNKDRYYEALEREKR